MQNFPPTMRLAQLILTCKFPSMDKPLDQKGPLKNITPWAYFGILWYLMQTELIKSIIIWLFPFPPA